MVCVIFLHFQRLLVCARLCCRKPWSGGLSLLEPGPRRRTPTPTPGCPSSRQGQLGCLLRQNFDFTSGSLGQRLTVTTFSCSSWIFIFLSLGEKNSINDEAKAEIIWFKARAFTSGDVHLLTRMKYKSTTIDVYRKCIYS